MTVPKVLPARRLAQWIATALIIAAGVQFTPVSYTHLRAHET